MGRLGKLPIKFDSTVKPEVSGSSFSVTGPKGTLKRDFPGRIKVEIGGSEIVIVDEGGTQTSRARQGSVRAHVANMVHGVTEGWKKDLEVNGPGYRAEVRGKDLVLSIGYSHPVILPAPEGVVFSVEKNIITVTGIDKEIVGQISALIRDSRRPNPYTGSGIRYLTEIVRRKVGKQAGKTE